MMRIRCRVLRTFWQQFKGLMFCQRVDVPRLFVLPQPRRFAIHSLFCPCFDAVFLDTAGCVVDVFAVRNIQLWIQPRLESLFLIEGPPGFAKRLRPGMRVGVDARDGWLSFAERSA